MNRAEEAWREYEGQFVSDDEVVRAFHLGYARGRADAWELPEVRAEELVDNEWYWAWGVNHEANPIAVKAAGPNVCVGRFKESKIYFRSFRGPLPLGGGE